jgi:hypothetical protein
MLSLSHTKQLRRNTKRNTLFSNIKFCTGIAEGNFEQQLSKKANKIIATMFFSLKATQLITHGSFADALQGSHMGSNITRRLVNHNIIGQLLFVLVSTEL